LKAVLKLGGFVFDSEPPGTKIAAYAKVIKSFASKNQMVVVTGGGPVARKYITAARELGASESVCDQIGIYVSRLNARVLVAGLGGSAFPDVPERFEDLAAYASSGLTVVMGGLQPGQSTNAVAALAAEAIGAELMVNATDVDGVYTADPHKDPNAAKLDEVTPEELTRILSKGGVKAGEYALMDLVAIQIIRRSKIPVTVMDGRDPSNIEKALHGKRIGTKIVPAKE
jgi:uridylate kinase